MRKLTQEEIVDWASADEGIDLQTFATCVKNDTLSTNEAKVLAVNVLPQYIDKNEREKCGIAGVDYSTYWRILKRETYQKAVTELCSLIWDKVRPEIQHIYVKLAKAGSERACERILEQSGVLDPPAKSTKDTLQPINILIVNEQRAKALSNGLERFGYAVVDNSDTDSG